MYVVGVDGSRQSQAALRWAVDAAAARADEVVAVRVWSGLAPRLRASREGRARAEGEEAALAESVRPAVAAHPGMRPLRTELREGDAATELFRVAGDSGVIVVGRSGFSGREATVMGSVVRQCVSRAQRPVVVVPDGDPAPPRGRVAVGVADESHALRAVEWAAAEAAARDATLVAVHAYAPSLVADAALEQLYEWELTHRVVDKALAAAGVAVDVEYAVHEEDTVRALLDAATGADLLVVGARTHGVLANVVATTAIRCAERSPVPVAVVPA
ncbi:MAG TPA: universal stress protein [Frankiaceae bacterium]|nr:universal stress protein [Frankiaceae bacterium]